MRPQQIVILVNSLAQAGGVERVARDLSAGFEEAGLEARVLSVWGSPYRGAELMPRYTRIVSRVFSAVVGRDLASKVARAEPLGRWLAQRRLARMVDDAAGTAVIAMDVLAAQILARARYEKATCVVQYHNSFRALAAGADLARLRKVASRVDLTLMLTQEDWQSLSVGLPGVRGGYMRNPTRIVTSPAAAVPRSKTVVALGRFEESKNFSLLLRAWSQSAASCPGWELQIFGTGSQGQALRHLVTDLGISTTATVNTPAACPQHVLAEASLLALPSRHEGLPLVILEAFAQGTPVVATDCAPGVRMLVDESEGGWLAPEGDPGEFAKALSEAIADRDEREARGGRAKNYVRRFDVALVVEDWLEALEHEASFKLVRRGAPGRGTAPQLSGKPPRKTGQVRRRC